MKSTSNKSQRGIGLIEILIGLVILGGILAAVLSRQGTAENTSKAQQLSADLVQLAGAIKSTYGPSNSYTSLSAADLAKLNQLPQTIKLSGTNLVDPWGNTMSLSGGTTSFAITVGGTTNAIDKDVCAAVARGLAQNAVAINVGAAATVGSGSTAGTVTGGSAYKAAGGAPDPANLATGCDGASRVVALQFR